MVSPWYNRNGWLGVKHQITYYLCGGWQVAQLSKFKEGGGLGISLEGTVDVENGQEVRPHHYIGSIRPDGPVGLNGRLKTNDELLEVAGQITF